MNYVKKLTKNSRLMSLFIAIQLAVVLIIMIILISAIKDRTIYYSFFKESLSENGIVVIPQIYDKNFADEESIFKIFDKATSVNGGKANYITLNDENEYGIMTYYNDEVMNTISPYLKEGKYPDVNSDMAECLICDSFGYKVGDIIDAKDIDGISFKIRISGILADNQKIFGTGGPAEYTYEYDYRDFYYTLNSPMRSGPLLISTENIMDKVNSHGTYMFYSLIAINFPEDAYTDEELSKLCNDHNLTLYGTTSEYQATSVAYINREIYTLLPIALCILVITIFTAIVTSIISTMRNLRNYAVLYLCGATWKRCSLINLLNFCAIGVVTLILDTAFFLIGKNTYLKETVIKISVENILVCAVILVVFLLLAAIVPLIVVHKKQPRDVLKTEFRQ